MDGLHWREPYSRIICLSVSWLKKTCLLWMKLALYLERPTLLLSDEAFYEALALTLLLLRRLWRYAYHKQDALGVETERESRT